MVRRLSLSLGAALLWGTVALAGTPADASSKPETPLETAKRLAASKEQKDRVQALQLLKALAQPGKSEGDEALARRFGKQIYDGDAPGPWDDSNNGNDDEAVKKSNFISSVDVIFNVPQPFDSSTFNPLLYPREKCADDFKWHAILWVKRSPTNPLKFVTVDSKCELDVGHTVVGQTP